MKCYLVSVPIPLVATRIEAIHVAPYLRTPMSLSKPEDDVFKLERWHDSHGYRQEIEKRIGKIELQRSPTEPAAFIEYLGITPCSPHLRRSILPQAIALDLLGFLGGSDFNIISPTVCFVTGLLSLWPASDDRSCSSSPSMI